MLKIDIERAMLTSEGKNLLKVDLEIAEHELLYRHIGHISFYY